MVLYFLIFLSKVIEIALSTLRLIVVSNGKKWLGAILQLFISLVWIFSTGAVVIGVHKDPLKILFFALGSLVGSYVGSIMEEKLAIGSNMITCITECGSQNLIDQIRTHGYAVTVMQGTGLEKEKDILLIMTTRKKRHHVVDIIHQYDQNCMIISESATTVSGGYS